MQTPQKRTNKGKYDPQLKVAIAREYLTSDLGYISLSRKYNIPGRTIQDFVKWYKEKYTEDITEQASSQSNNQVDEKELKITALQMLIENASKELGVDLIKKFGTKQSKK